MVNAGFVNFVLNGHDIFYGADGAAAFVERAMAGSRMRVLSNRLCMV
jgi:hypothetical protein